MSLQVEPIVEDLHKLFIDYDYSADKSVVSVALQYSRDYEAKELVSDFKKQLQKEKNKIGVEEFIFKNECLRFLEKIKEFNINAQLADIQNILSISYGFDGWKDYRKYLKKQG